MIEPTGYTALDLIGFTDRGGYDPDAYYVKNDIVTVGNTKWRCLIDDTHNITPTEGVNWTIYLESATSLAGMSDTDITNPKPYNVLMHNGTEWENSDVLKEYELVESDNLCQIEATTQSNNGVTYTINADGIITATTSSDTHNLSFIYLFTDTWIPNILPAKKLKLVGCPSGGSNNTYRLIVQFNTIQGEGGSDIENFIDTGDGVEISATAAAKPYFKLSITVGANVPMDNKVFKPMITTNLNATYADFVPFYKALKDSKLDIADEQILGAWNLLENKATTHVENGITFTVGNKKEVRVTTGSTAPSSATNYDIQRITGNIFENLEVGKRYFLTGCPTGGSNSTYCMIMNHRDTASGTVTYLNDTGNGIEFVYDGTWTTYQIAVQIWPAVGANFDKTFYPMISVKKDMPYVPHAKTNRELTKDVTSLQNCKYHTTASGSKTITCTNQYQQFLMTVFKGSARAVYLITQAGSINATYLEQVYLTSGQTAPGITVTNTGTYTFTINLPSSTQTNITSVEPFTVA